MSITTGKVIWAMETLQPMAATPLPGKLAKKLHKMLSALGKIVEEYEAARGNLLKQYQVLDDKGQPIIIDGRYRLSDDRAYATELQAVLNEPETLPTVEIDDDLLDRVDITVQQISAMGLFASEGADD